MKMQLRNLVTTVLLSSFLLVAGLFIYPHSLYAAEDYGSVVAVKPSRVRLGQDLQVQVQDLTKLVNYVNCTDGHQPCTAKKIILYLDDIPMTALTPYAINPMAGAITGTLTFHLQHNPEAQAAWNRIIGSPRWQSPYSKVTVGVEDGPVLPSSVSDFTFVVIPPGWALFYLLLLVALLIAFGVLVQKTNLLRNSGPEPGGNHRKPYSLARSQMAWWFFLVLAAYLFIGVVTSNIATSINNTVLILTGISAATAIGSAVITVNKENSTLIQSQTAQAQVYVQEKIKKVQTDLKQMATARSDELKTELAILKTQDEKLKNISQGWYLDILNDADGVSFHRFQIAAWTLVLGIIFVVKVYQTLAMPEFDQSLLTLLGISAGAYIGLKLPEPTIPTGVLEQKEGAS
jgi:hypothetical protein